jgi:hypothetical protein
VAICMLSWVVLCAPLVACRKPWVVFPTMFICWWDYEPRIASPM